MPQNTMTSQRAVALIERPLLKSTDRDGTTILFGFLRDDQWAIVRSGVVVARGDGNPESIGEGLAIFLEMSDPALVMNAQRAIRGEGREGMTPAATNESFHDGRR